MQAAAEPRRRAGVAPAAARGLPPQSRLRRSPTCATSRSGGGGGTLTAGLFLKEFVGPKPWAHLDIAGTARASVPTTPTCRRAAPAYGVRTLIELASDVQARRSMTRRCPRLGSASCSRSPFWRRAVRRRRRRARRSRRRLARAEARSRSTATDNLFTPAEHHHRSRHEGDVEEHRHGRAQREEVGRRARLRCAVRRRMQQVRSGRELLVHVHEGRHTFSYTCTIHSRDERTRRGRRRNSATTTVP